MLWYLSGTWSITSVIDHVAIVYIIHAYKRILCVTYKLGVSNIILIDFRYGSMTYLSICKFNNTINFIYRFTMSTMYCRIWLVELLLFTELVGALYLNCRIPHHKGKPLSASFMNDAYVLNKRNFCHLNLWWGILQSSQALYVLL